MRHVRNALFLLSCSTVGLGQVSFSDNFDDQDIDGWEVFDPIGFALGQPHAEVSFSEGTVRLDGPAHPAFGSGVAAISRSEVVFTDFEQAIDIAENNSSVDGFFGLTKVVDPTTGYFLSIGKTNPDLAPPNATAFNIARRDGAEAPPVFITDPFVQGTIPTENIRLVFRGQGSSLTGEVYNLDDLSAPLASVSTVDETYSSGYGGFFVFGSTPPPPNPPNLESFGNARFDNYSLTATVPEPTALTMGIAGILAVLVQSRRKRSIHR